MDEHGPDANITAKAVMYGQNSKKYPTYYSLVVILNIQFFHSVLFV